MSKNALFMIEGGKALEMVRAHIADFKRVKAEIRAMAQELGVTEVYTCHMTGRMTGAKFGGDVHPEFTKPKSRRSPASYPKKGTNWEKRLASAQGYRNPSTWLSTEFNIPLWLSYKTDCGEGHTCIGSMLVECGFLFLSEDGPYAMWAPDVPAIVAEYVERGHKVSEPAASFKFGIDGCRRITDDEWEVLVLQRDLERKRQSIESQKAAA